jgi:quercetin dioxygenase-like cupin family protein
MSSQTAVKLSPTFFPFPAKFKELEPYRGRFEAHKLEGEQVDIYFAGYPAGTVIEEHQHDTDNHGLITAGTLYITVNGKEQKFSAGEWYYIPRNTPHAARFEEDTAEIEFWFK